MNHMDGRMFCSLNGESKLAEYDTSLFFSVSQVTDWYLSNLSTASRGNESETPKPKHHWTMSTCLVREASQRIASRQASCDIMVVARSVPSSVLAPRPGAPFVACSTHVILREEKIGPGRLRPERRQLSMATGMRFLRAWHHAGKRHGAC